MEQKERMWGLQEECVLRGREGLRIVQRNAWVMRIVLLGRKTGAAMRVLA
ncbi:hypothetical protein B9Z19DRAFT_1041831 [Tuber borchii]|uniref:Uncharacterized protein n=1 Tax=Tuber borchii TaxID=42251 RepID=A0A2T7A2X9_TUBBO|nr:hypothetical protein B9Z19DRAFT_1041831 [Tuber borchii]